MKLLETLKNEKQNNLCIVKSGDGFLFSRLKYVEEQRIVAIFENVRDSIISVLICFAPSFANVEEAIQIILCEPNCSLLYKSEL